MNDEKKQRTADDPMVDRVWEMLDRWEAPDLPPDFQSRVLERTIGRTTRSVPRFRQRWQWRWRGLSLTAAAAAAGLAAVLLVGRGGQEQKTDSLVQTRVVKEVGSDVSSVHAPEIELLENLEVLEAMGDIEPLDEMLRTEETGEHSRLKNAGSGRVKV